MKTILFNYELKITNYGLNPPLAPPRRGNRAVISSCIITPRIPLLGGARGGFIRHVTTLVLLSLWLLSRAEVHAQNNVGIGTTTPNPKAILDLQANDKGLLVPRMNTAQMNAIVAPPNGLLIYNTNDNCFSYYNTTTSAWKSMCATGGGTTTGITNSGDTVIINLLKTDSLFANYIKIDSAFINQLFTNYIKTDSAYIKNLVSQYITTDSISAGFGRFDSLYINGQNITNYLNTLINSKDTVTIKYLQTDSIYSILIKADSAFILNILTNTITSHYITTDSLYASFGSFDSLQIGGKNMSAIITDSIAAQAWLTKGNVATNSYKLGTLNPRDLHIVTNNTEAITIANGTQNVGIGQTLPSQKLDVLGNVQFTGALMPASIAGTTGEVLVSQGTGIAPIWKPITTIINNTTNTSLNVVNIDSSTTNVANITNAIINNATIDSSTTNVANITNATITNATIDSSITNVAYITNLTSDTANINTLNIGGQNIMNTIADSIKSQAWLLKGNTGTTAGTNFIGTTDVQDLVFKTNSIENMRILNTNGNVGIGTTTPIAPLHVLGKIYTEDGFVSERNDIGGILGYISLKGRNSSSINPNLSQWSLYNMRDYGGQNGLSIYEYYDGNNDGILCAGDPVCNSRLFIQSFTGNVGIGTTSPTTTLDVNGSVAYKEGAALNLSNGANNDIALGAFSYFRITGPTAGFAVSGLTAGTDGRIITLYNTTTQVMTIVNNLTSAVANQITTLTNADVVTPAGPNVVQLQYNATQAKWIIIGGQNLSNPSSSSGGSKHCYTCDGF
ncbi:MAG: hypothetical protein ABL940_08350 [Bacteroidia bacterium]